MALKSWVDSANWTSDFPLENLPFGVYRSGRRSRIGVAIGERILDLCGCFEEGLIHEDACTERTLNGLMAKGRKATRALRARLQELLAEGSTDRHRLTKHLVPQRGAEMLLPCAIGDYTDFYASIHHATRVGSLFRPDNPLLPNYKWMPIGYHGRSSSIVVSGTPFLRPNGQRKEEASDAPSFGPSRRLDYELEVGAVIGPGNALGEPIGVDAAEEHVFGLCLVNDWSARDIQAWEYQPLGPFLAKNFATTISPWIVTLDALQPFRIPPAPRPAGDPEPLPHLRGGLGIDMTVEVWLRGAGMTDPVRLSRGNFREMYWTLAQLVAHHTSNGCNLRTGDLLASGTVSGGSPESGGCLLELTLGGSEPVSLPGGGERRFLEDGDEVILRAYCEKGDVRLGFGECVGTVTAAPRPL
jgi:fumarylacetoacetase